MTKEYKQQLADLESGMNQILKKINDPKDRTKHTKAIEAKHIQEARIEFFKKGYNFRNRELKEQQELNPKKPVHISVIANEDDSTNTSFYFKEAMVGQLSMLNHELDILKGEIISRIKDAPKSYEVEDWGEDDDNHN